STLCLTASSTPETGMALILRFFRTGIRSRDSVPSSHCKIRSLRNVRRSFCWLHHPSTYSLSSFQSDKLRTETTPFLSAYSKCKYLIPALLRELFSRYAWFFALSACDAAVSDL